MMKAAPVVRGVACAADRFVRFSGGADVAEESRDVEALEALEDEAVAVSVGDA